LNGWVMRMEQGLSPEMVEAGFVASAEYIQDHCNNAAIWVTGLYRDLLGRNPSGSEVSAWLNRMAMGATPFQVAVGFTTSQEREAIVITQDYVSFLGRAPEAGAVAAWLMRISQGANRADVANAIVGSDEYFMRYQNNYPMFIVATYQNVLHRTPSTPEINAWLMSIGQPTI
jgi:hypothetical protein